MPGDLKDARRTGQRQTSLPGSPTYSIAKGRSRGLVAKRLAHCAQASSPGTSIGCAGGQLAQQRDLPLADDP